MTSKLNRRRFLKSSLASAAALGALGRWPVHAEPTGANGDVRLAVIGLNGRGGAHVAAYRGMKGVRIVALCDVDKNVLARSVKMFQGHKQPVTGYADIRKLLEDKEVDAVSIATPNHWHALGAIWAMQAGKDVYVEKPVSHNVWEGRQMVAAAVKYNRIIQTGTQARTGLREPMQWLHEGNIGKPIRARAVLYKRRNSIGKTTGPQPLPPGLDYDLWSGPAPVEPLRRKKLHYDWHWVWPTGNGDLGNTGPHHMDAARWALGVEELSPSVLCIGGRLGYEDDATTPNTQIVFHDYKPAPLIFEMRGLPSASGSDTMDKFRGIPVGIIVDCEHGSMTTPGYSDAVFYDADGKEIKKFTGPPDEAHFANFIAAVRSRKSSDLHASILDGHLSSALCHTGNISYRVGKNATPDEAREAVPPDKDATDTFDRIRQHLLANGVDLAKTPLTLGAALKMDPKTETFIGNDAASQLLTRDYRAPFVVPQIA